MADFVYKTNPGETVARELLLAFLNTGTADEPVWSVLGKRVTDSSIAFDWSTETNTDILGDTWESAEITVTYRTGVSGNSDRLNITDRMDNLRFWAKQNPPDGCRVILAGMSKPKAKSASGTEDFVLTMRIEEF